MKTKCQKTPFIDFWRISATFLILVTLVSAIGVNQVTAAPSFGPSLDPAGWFDEAWSYRRTVSISNSSAATLTDYQVLMTLDSSSDFSKANSDGGGSTCCNGHRRQPALRD